MENTKAVKKIRNNFTLGLGFFYKIYASGTRKDKWQQSYFTAIAYDPGIHDWKVKSKLQSA